jgi:hypothetical protein
LAGFTAPIFAASLGASAGLAFSYAFCPYLWPLAVVQCPLWVPVGGVVVVVMQRRRRRLRGGCVRIGWTWIGLPLLIGMFIGLLTSSDSQLRAELQHGVRLPSSARHIQCKGDAIAIPDGAKLTWFEIDAGDLKRFLEKLETLERDGYWATWRSSGVVKKTWARFSAELGNPEYSGFAKTWSGAEKLNTAIRCRSPVGADNLIVEIYDLPGGGHVIKMLSDWN